MDVVIPIAAEDPAFVEAGYSCPKPLIDINGTPMIKWATASLDGVADESSYIFPVLQSHVREYAIDDRLREIYSDDITIVPIDEMTDGAAETVLKARQYIGDKELVVAFGDQYAHIPLGESIRSTTADVLIPVFESSSPAWSYVATRGDGTVTEAAEKEVISKHATAGIYYFRDGADFIRGAEAMIEKNIRKNGLFYVCPIFNELLRMSRRIDTVPVDRMVSFGTPSAVQDFNLRFDQVTEA
jgi:NDP-sugar pyrophosphorylase family protein